MNQQPFPAAPAATIRSLNTVETKETIDEWFNQTREFIRAVPSYSDHYCSFCLRNPATREQAKTHFIKDCHHLSQSDRDYITKLHDRALQNRLLAVEERDPDLSVRFIGMVESYYGLEAQVTQPPPQENLHMWPRLRRPTKADHYCSSCLKNPATREQAKTHFIKDCHHLSQSDRNYITKLHDRALQNRRLAVEERDPDISVRFIGMVESYYGLEAQVRQTSPANLLANGEEVKTNLSNALAGAGVGVSAVRLSGETPFLQGSADEVDARAAGVPARRISSDREEIVREDQLEEKSESRPESVHEGKPDSLHEDRPESRPSSPELVHEEVVESRLQEKPESRPESVHENKPESVRKPQSQPSSPESVHEGKPDPSPSFTASIESETGSQVNQNIEGDIRCPEECIICDTCAASLNAPSADESDPPPPTEQQPTPVPTAAGETSADCNPTAGVSTSTDPAQPGLAVQPGTSSGSETGAAGQISQKEPVPLVDYIHNVMKFVNTILSNNSTDNHWRVFVNQKGLVPLMGILGLPNLPIDFPAHTACTSVAAVAKSVLNLAHEPQVLEQGLVHLDEVLRRPEPLHKPMKEPRESILLHELVGNLPDGQYAIEPSMNCKASTNALTWLQPNILEVKGPPLC